MKQFACCKILLVLISVFLNNEVPAQRNYAKLVNPFIGTGGHGHTYPGASMPFGMMQLSPDTRMADWDGSSGYHYSDSLIYGFSHTHLSGVGIPDYCDVLFMPFTGKVKWNNTEYRSTFSHKNEKASPGYYEVLLDKHKIKAQLATSFRTGMHQYTFPKETTDGSILIDLAHRDEVLETWIEKISATEIRGLRRSKSWAQDQSLYFHVEFEKPIAEFAVLNDEGEVVHTDLAKGKKLKAFIRFNLGTNKMIKARVGISGVSADGAAMNLDAEMKHWDLERVRKEAQAEWNKELSKIDVRGGTADQQSVFYTALYHTMLAPNIYTDVDGSYRGTDGKTHTAHGFVNYSVFSLWDTYRAFHPLMAIINRKRTKDWIATFLAQYKFGGMLPVWELSGNETFCMIGYHSVPVIWDAYQKGIRGFDTSLVLKAMLSYAESNRYGLDHYRNHGYIPNDKEHESVSKTLEYAYDDWCIAQYARAVGNDTVYRKYIERAQYYKNVFDPATKKMRGKVGAMWHQPFDPREINNFYTEGNSWQYSFAVPQDITGMINLYGGRTGFLKYLNELFTTTSQTTGRDQADVTGLIGQYAHGNEPSHHMAYLYNYVAQPEKTQELIHKICNEFYKNTPDGLIGNEDCGQMSAWYIFSSMGFYPVTPGSGEYAIGTPLFDEVTINLENGKKFIVKAARNRKSDYYVKSAALNGKPYKKSFLKHADLANGGFFSFSLEGKPSAAWGRRDEDIPTTSIDDHTIIPVPYFDVVSNKFKDSLLVQVKSLNQETSIVSDQDVQVRQPIFIRNSSAISLYAVKNGKRSKTVSQHFFKLPSDKTITVQSNVHPLYTAGGNEALIDSVFGKENWRSGEWQSYFDTDFEAIVDLQIVKPVSYVGVHVLQDVSPWIIYPKEVIVYTSIDGKTYAEAATIRNTVKVEMNGPQVQELGAKLNLSARYIKIKAVNGGKLPAWHESAGNPSHLFIDEVMVK
ncbi:MAG TPA: GH92 family glycosyl hydrolase [Flavisolibacter sp.]